MPILELVIPKSCRCFAPVRVVQPNGNGIIKRLENGWIKSAVMVVAERPTVGLVRQDSSSEKSCRHPFSSDAGRSARRSPILSASVETKPGSFVVRYTYRETAFGKQGCAKEAVADPRRAEDSALRIPRLPARGLNAPN